ncbi:uncharacterized protein C8Q71DRAFT_566215 [Rhodofomes roseus]|uniref:Uncharacterized protein n=1 Tax=Rhodofomes roseus TaxID=34475 RepID=A0ABQ8KIQ2_9APHY|nr:uncharacterized protein C8Q71DRAFT_566215 [Rhodofomes roseus]KAH9837875.1 hypothetical protein C8Q71DRAFT_566215 [Rhodofomes roseus]
MWLLDGQHLEQERGLCSPRHPSLDLAQWTTTCAYGCRRLPGPLSPQLPSSCPRSRRFLHAGHRLRRRRYPRAGLDGMAHDVSYLGLQTVLRSVGRTLYWSMFFVASLKGMLSDWNVQGASGAICKARTNPRMCQVSRFLCWLETPRCTQYTFPSLS